MDNFIIRKIFISLHPKLKKTLMSESYSYGTDGFFLLFVRIYILLIISCLCVFISFIVVVVTAMVIPKIIVIAVKHPLYYKHNSRKGT
jgi:hypothetical protein